MYPAGYVAQAIGTVIHGIEAVHRSQQSLCGTDIRCGFLSFDVLFARLQCQTISRTSVSIFGHTDNTAGDVAFVVHTRGQISC